MRLREPGERRWSRVFGALLAFAALAQPGAVRASPAAASARGAAAPGAGEPSAPPREVVFVIDASAAMRGAPLEQAKEALAAALESLRPVDTFNVLALGGRTRALFPASWPTRPESLERAARWIDRLEVDGSAEVLAGLAAALGPPDEGYATPGARVVREVVVFAPGAVTGPDEAAAPAVPATPPDTEAVDAASPRAGLDRAGREHAGPHRAAGLDRAELAGAGIARSGARVAGAAGGERGTAAWLLLLGAGLALFAAALAYALRRGLTAAEAAR